MRNRTRCFVPALVTVLMWLIAGAAQAQPFEGFVDVRGTKVYAVAEGSGDPVLLLHGGFMDSTMWADDAAALTARFKVIRFDLRGFGQSPASPAPYLPSDDILAVLDRFGATRAHIVGISMGGGHAIDFALAHPERVHTLVLAEPGLSGWQWSADVTGTMQAVMQVNRERGRDAAIDEFLTRPVFATARRKPAAFATIRAQLARNFALDPRGMQQPARPAVDRLTELTMPTLVLAGELGGPDAHQIAARIEKAVRGARRIVVKNSGHMINLEQPEVFRSTVREFLIAHPLTRR